MYVQRPVNGFSVQPTTTVVNRRRKPEEKRSRGQKPTVPELYTVVESWGCGGKVWRRDDFDRTLGTVQNFDEKDGHCLKVLNAHSLYVVLLNLI